MSTSHLINILTSGMGTALLRPHAYLDPGSGSFILQLLIASLVGVGFFFRSTWMRLLGRFRKSDPGVDEDDEQDADGK